MPTKSHEITRLLDQFEPAYAGDAWHGTPVRALLDDVDAGLAAAHPVPGAHSNWELVEDWPATPSPTGAART